MGLIVSEYRLFTVGNLTEEKPPSEPYYFLPICLFP